MVENHGHVEASEVAALHEAGYGDEEIVELIGAIALNLFRNYFNLAVQTEIDFPLIRVTEPLPKAAGKVVGPPYSGTASLPNRPAAAKDSECFQFKRGTEMKKENASMSGKRQITGNVLMILAGLMLTGSAGAKFAHVPKTCYGAWRDGFRRKQVNVRRGLEVISALLFLIPLTSIGRAAPGFPRSWVEQSLHTCSTASLLLSHPLSYSSSGLARGCAIRSSCGVSARRLKKRAGQSARRPGYADCKDGSKSKL